MSVSVTLSPVFNGQQFFDANGSPLSGGFIYTYQAGSFSSLQTTYSDVNGTIPNTNPIVLDSSGRIDTEIWLITGNAYNLALTDSSNTAITNVDNVSSASPLSGSTGATKIGYLNPSTGAVTETVAAKLNQYVSVLDFGADPTGTTDSTTSIQNAINACSYVWFPPGTYKISSPINLPAGQTCLGAGSGQFSANRSTVKNLTSGSGCFYMNQGTGAPNQVDGPTITGFNLLADNPIILNSPSVLIQNGSGAANPPIMKAKFEDVYVQANTVGSNIGISMSQNFDFIITRCLIEGFSINLLLQGCDIGAVHTNRIEQFSNYGILEIGTNTFGSQTEIFNNDILIYGSGVSGCTAIKSCGYHPRIYNNYIESQGGTTPAIAIDISAVGCPTYGANTPNTNPFTIVCQDNRIDGQANFTTSVYFLDGTNPSVSTKLSDPGTSGPIGTDLYINGGYLPIKFNSSHLCDYEISLANLDNVAYADYFTGELPVLSDGITIDTKSFCFLQGLSTNNSWNYVFYNGAESIVILPSMPSLLYGYLPSYVAGQAHPLEPGTYYTILITARSPISEHLQIGYLSNGVGSSLVDLALTPSYTTYAITSGAVAAPVNTHLFGFYLSRSSGTTDPIFIQSIQFVKNMTAGYGTPTGNARVANYPGGSATLLQTSETLAQLILDLENKGIIGT
jgi:hypothetical protein